MEVLEYRGEALIPELLVGNVQRCSGYQKLPERNTRFTPAAIDLGALPVTRFHLGAEGAGVSGAGTLHGADRFSVQTRGDGPAGELHFQKLLDLANLAAF